VLAGVFLLGSLFVWSYWPTLERLVAAWSREPDYSHGFFVVPLAGLLLWLDRDRFPAGRLGASWLGLLLLAVSLGMRLVAARVYLEALDGWSILPWVAGAVLLLGGPALLRWSLPSIAFLFFMVPLPFRLEQTLSVPLQQIATKTSCFALQCLGQPALAEGTTILLDEQQLEVEQACSGLRIFVGILALAFAYVVATRRPLGDKLLLLASAIPIALAANAIRIVITALLYRHVSGEAARRFSHDLAGWFMVPLAALLFALVLAYLSRALREVRPVDVGELLRRERAPGASA